MSLIFGPVSVFAWGLGSDLHPLKLVQNTCFKFMVSYMNFTYLDFEHSGQGEIGLLELWC